MVREKFLRKPLSALTFAKGFARVPFQISRGRAGRNGEPRKARGGRHTDEKKYGDDEQRRAALPVRPALRVAAAGRHLLRRSSSTYRFLLVRLRCRFSHLTAWRSQRGSREIWKGTLASPDIAMRSQHTVALVSGGLDSLALVHTLLARGHTVWPLYVRCGLRWEPAELRWLRRWLAAIRPRALQRAALPRQRGWYRLGRQPRLRRLAIMQVPLGELYRGHWSVTGKRVPSHRSADAAVYLPGRNLILLSHAAVYGAQRGASRVALGTLASNPFGDATPKFFQQVGMCASQALGRSVRVLAPLRTFSKASVIRRVRTQPLALTCSCIQPRGWQHCGRCNKCAERRRAFREAGVMDPTKYAA